MGFMVDMSQQHVQQEQGMTTRQIAGRQYNPRHTHYKLHVKSLPGGPIFLQNHFPRQFIFVMLLVVMVISNRDIHFGKRNSPGNSEIQVQSGLYCLLWRTKVRTNVFLHKLFEHPQGSGTSRQNSRDIPASPRNPRKTISRRRERAF